MLSEQINQAIKAAMRAKDKVRLSTLRDIKSKIMVEATAASGQEITDAVVLKICMKLHKQRKETYALYKEQGREDNNKGPVVSVFVFVFVFFRDLPTIKKEQHK